MNISRSEDESRIHEAIKSVRNTLKKECLITVTATPYANFRLDPEKEKHLYPTIFKTLIPFRSNLLYSESTRNMERQRLV